MLNGCACTNLVSQQGSQQGGAVSSALVPSASSSKSSVFTSSGLPGSPGNPHATAASVHAYPFSSVFA